jgi:hypothetical protein
MEMRLPASLLNSVDLPTLACPQSRQSVLPWGTVLSLLSFGKERSKENLILAMMTSHHNER